MVHSGSSYQLTKLKKSYMIPEFIFFAIGRQRTILIVNIRAKPKQFFEGDADRHLRVKKKKKKIRK